MRVDLAKKFGSIAITVVLIMAVMLLTIMTSLFVVNSPSNDITAELPDVGGGDVAEPTPDGYKANEYTRPIPEDGLTPSKGDNPRTPRQYINDEYPKAGWVKLTTVADIQNWLNNQDGKDAYLDLGTVDGNEITNIDFEWAATRTDSTILEGRTLDGCGYTITLTKSTPNDTPAGTQNSKFVGICRGTIKNIKFISSGSYQVKTVTNSKVYTGLVIGDHYGTVENVKVVVAAGSFTKGVAIYSDTGTGKGWSYVGGIAGLSQGKFDKCTVQMDGGGFYTYGEGKAPWFGQQDGSGFIGGFTGKMDGGSLTNCSFIYNSGYFKAESSKNNKHVGSVAGEMTGGSINGYVMRNVPFNNNLADSGGENLGKWGEIAGYINNKHSMTNVYYVNKDKAPRYANAWQDNDSNKSNNASMTYINDLDIEIKFDKDIPDKIVITNNKIGNGKLYWALEQHTYGSINSGMVGSNLAKNDTYSIDDLYAYGFGKSIIVDKMNLPDKPFGGNPLYIRTGDEYKLASIESKAVAFNGESQTVNASFVDYDNNPIAADASNFGLTYNESNIAPSLPSSIPYIAKARAPGSTKFAYLDLANRKLARIDDSKAGQLRINMGNTDVQTDYVSGAWVSDPVLFNTTIANAAANITAVPTRVGISLDGVNFIDYQTWDDSSRYKAYASTNTAPGMAYRFALFVGNTQVTAMSSVGYEVKYDDVTPTMRLHDTNKAGGERDLSQIFSDYTINADGNALPEIWFTADAGPSGMILQVKAWRDGVEYSDWSTISEGERPLINGMPARDIYRQRFYGEDLAGGQSHNEAFTGSWRFQVRATNGAGIPAQGGDADGIIEVTININYNDTFTINNNIILGDDNTDVLDKVEVTLDKASYSKGDAIGYKVSVDNTDSPAYLTYYIKSINGVAVADEYKFLIEGTTPLVVDAVGTVLDLDVEMGIMYNEVISITNKVVYNDSTTLPEDMVVTITAPTKEKFAFGEKFNYQVAITNDVNNVLYEYYIVSINGVLADATNKYDMTSEITITDIGFTTLSQEIVIVIGRAELDSVTLTNSITFNGSTELPQGLADMITVTKSLDKDLYALGDKVIYTVTITNDTAVAHKAYYITSINGVAVTDKYSASVEVIVGSELNQNVVIDISEENLPIFTFSNSDSLGEGVDIAPLAGKVAFTTDKASYAIGETATITVTVTNDIDSMLQYYIISINGVSIESVNEMNGSITITITDDFIGTNNTVINVVFGVRDLTPAPPPEV